MKKLLLTLAAGIAFAPVFAQDLQHATQSVVFTHTNLQDAHTAIPVNTGKPVHSNKTTATGSSWFAYADLFAGNPGAKSYYFAHYQDSNVVGNGSQGAYNLHTYGWGMSFDPTDSVFWNGESSVGTVTNVDLIPAFRVTHGDAYTIDSVSFNFAYKRFTNYDDTLYIQYIKAKRGTNPFGIWSLYYTDAAQFADGTGNFISAIWDSTTNLLSDSIAAGSVMTQKILLDQTFHADSFSNGYSKQIGIGIEPPSPLNMAADDVLLIFATVKFSGHYPLGTNESNANTARFIGYDLSGINAEPKQSGGSYMSGLAATQQNKYTPPYNAVPFQGHNILLSSLGYTSDGRTTDFAFKISCPTCPTLSVADINSNIVLTNAYPNPANTEVRVPFSLKNAANVTVTLANTVGQVVKTQNMGNTTKGEAVINVSDLANGVYFYTVNADGQHKTGRVVVNN